jgi:hypothetical protein
MNKITAINDKANSFLFELSNQLKNIEFNSNLVELKYDSILECISKKITKSLNFIEICIQPFPEIMGGWDISSFSEPIGDGPNGWIVINFQTKNIEEHNSEYYDFELIHKVARNENAFLSTLIFLANYYKKYLNSNSDEQNYNPRFKSNIYFRRKLAIKLSAIAGGEEFYDFWKEYWMAWSDQEVFEAGPIGYILDLPSTLKQEGDKYVWA